MDRKELYLNVRKAYRLVYEVQDSIIDMVEYIREKILHEDCAGKQLFSDAIAKRKNVSKGYVTDNIGMGMWSWDYFPTFMYMYYFTGISTVTQCSSFSIVQVMDDGFISAFNKNNPPSTRDFRGITDSESYFLLAYSIWEIDQRPIWFEYNGTEPIDDEMGEIMRISEEIEKKNNHPYIVKTDNGDRCFIVKKISAESLGSKAEVDRVLQDFAKLVLDKTGYQLLVEE